MENNETGTNRRGFLGCAARIVFAGLVLKLLHNSLKDEEIEIKPIAISDLNGDGQEDYLVAFPGSTSLPNHYGVRWYNGKGVRVENNDLTLGNGNVEINRRYFAKGTAQQCMPTHIRSSAYPTNLRFHNIEVSPDKRHLDLVVTDNTPDFPVTVPVYRGPILQNPHYKKDSNH